MFSRLKEDIRAIKERDPAARSSLEIWLTYSGLHAIRSHRRANWLFRHNMKFLARLLSQCSKRRTGIEIHPGAQLGRGVFIDHGTGIVIGETAIVGDNVTLYQGVTLGGTGKDKGRRHPTIEENVLIGAGAKVLGPFTVRKNAKIAANAVVLEEVPEGATAVGVPARIVRVYGKKPDGYDLDQIHIPDPLAQEICRLETKIAALRKEFNK